MSFDQQGESLELHEPAGEQHDRHGLALFVDERIEIVARVPHRSGPAVRAPAERLVDQPPLPCGLPLFGCMAAAIVRGASRPFGEVAGWKRVRYTSRALIRAAGAKCEANE